MRLRKQIAVLRESPCQRFKHFVRIIDFGNFRFEVHRNFIFQPGIRRGNQLNDVLPNRKLRIDEPVVIWNPAKHAVQPDLILVRKSRIKQCRFVIIHRLQINRSIYATIQRIFPKQKGFHDIHIRTAQDELQRRCIAIAVNQSLQNAVHSLHNLAQIRVLIQHQNHRLFFRRFKQIRQQRFHAVKRRLWEMKCIRQQHRQTLRVILFCCLFTFKIDAGYIRFAQALLNQLTFADAPAPFIQKQTMQILALLLPSVQFHLLGHLRLGLVRVHYTVDDRKKQPFKALSFYRTRLSRRRIRKK